MAGLFVPSGIGLTRFDTVRLSLGGSAATGVHTRVKVSTSADIAEHLLGSRLGVSLPSLPVYFEFLPPEVVDQLIIRHHGSHAFFELTLQDSVTELIFLQLHQFFHLLLQLPQA